MGLSSSQARLLTLTSRMHQIEYKAAKLEAQKLQMANQSAKVYEEYLDALEATKIQFKQIGDDGSTRYIPANYYDLCSGNSTPTFGLFSTGNDKLKVPQIYIDAFEAASDAEGFASALSGYTPPASPTPNLGNVGGNGAGGGGVIPQEVLPAQTAPGMNMVNPGHKTSAEPVVPVTPAIPASTEDYEISRGEAKSFEFGTTSKTLKLNNPFNSNGAYYYTITSTSTQNVVFNYLDNGRLVVSGSGLTIVANGNQNDDLIIMGNSNNVNTNSGNDRVRVGEVVDSYAVYHSSYSGNIINTGDGTDYIIYNGSGTVTPGNGTDTVYKSGSVTVSGTGDNVFTDKSSQNATLDWTMQQQYGDCKFLSFLNSLNCPLSEFVTITPNSGNTEYTVNFASGATTVVKMSDVNADSLRSKGDLDNIIMERAFEQLINADGVTLKETGNSFGSSLNNYLISKYFFGMDNAGQDELQDTRFRAILNAYLNGQVSNLVVCSRKDDIKNGVYASHAYAVKNAVPGTSIQLVNPHDSNDVINLDWDKFYEDFKTVALFGDTYNKYVDDLGFNTITYRSYVATEPNSTNNYDVDNSIYYAEEIVKNSISPVDVVTSDLEPESNAKYNALIALYNAMNTFGYEEIPENMMKSEDFLVNMINNGSVYLKMFYTKTGEWVDTSVATNTALQEVNNELYLKKAEAKYEADMRRIDQKDRKYDHDLAAIETERNAIKQEMETLKTVAKDNVERTFKLFS